MAKYEERASGSFDSEAENKFMTCDGWCACEHHRIKKQCEQLRCGAGGVHVYSTMSETSSECFADHSTAR